MTSQVKKWRLATPLTIWPERHWANEMIVLAGDAFGGPKIEGAALSGLSAANYLQQIIKRIIEASSAAGAARNASVTTPCGM